MRDFMPGQKSVTMEIIGPRGELTVTILLNGHAMKLPSNIYVYDPRSVLLSTLVREVSLCSG